jgi:hypothetical protein
MDAARSQPSDSPAPEHFNWVGFLFFRFLAFFLFSFSIHLPFFSSYPTSDKSIACVFISFPSLEFGAAYPWFEVFTVLVNPLRSTWAY